MCAKMLAVSLLNIFDAYIFLYKQASMYINSGLKKGGRYIVDGVCSKSVCMSECVFLKDINAKRSLTVASILRT